MLCIIPAAGLGSRFAPLSRVLPKELLPLGQKPLIHHALEEADRAGFDRVIIVTSPGKLGMRRYFEPDHELERTLLQRGEFQALARLRDAVDIAQRLRVQFLIQPRPSGLGDAIRLCREAAEQVAGVLLPDDVTPGTDHWRKLLAIHKSTRAAVICVRTMSWDDSDRFGVAICEAAGNTLRVHQVIEKPVSGLRISNLAVFGRYLLTETVFDALGRLAAAAPSELELSLALDRVAHMGGLCAVRFEDKLYDCGLPDRYTEAVVRYAREHPI